MVDNGIGATENDCVKYLLEITEKGMQQYEFMQRMMEYKKGDQTDTVVAWMRSLNPKSEA